ncbi:MAG: hypothetical protein ACLPWS_04075 [Rhodomicrobium sp.]
MPEEKRKNDLGSYRCETCQDAGYRIYTADGVSYSAAAAAANFIGANGALVRNAAVKRRRRQSGRRNSCLIQRPFPAFGDKPVAVLCKAHGISEYWIILCGGELPANAKAA